MVRPTQSRNTQTNRSQNPSNTPLTPSQPFVMTFNASGAVVQSSQSDRPRGFVADPQLSTSPVNQQLKRLSTYHGQLIEPRKKHTRME